MQEEGRLSGPLICIFYKIHINISGTNIPINNIIGAKAPMKGP